MGTFVFTNGTSHNVHDIDACEGRPCVIHNPSDHPLKDAPKWLCNDSQVERICTHSFRHPDPDSVTYFLNQGLNVSFAHNCCEENCCGLDSRPDQWNVDIDKAAERLYAFMGHDEFAKWEDLAEAGKKYYKRAFISILIPH